MNTNIITIPSGDSMDKDLEFRDRNQELEDMTGTIVVFTARDSEGNVIIEKTSDVEDDEAAEQIEWIDQVNGMAKLHFIPSDTESYEGVFDYDIEVEVVASGKKFTPIKSFIQIEKDITQ